MVVGESVELVDGRGDIEEVGKLPFPQQDPNRELVEHVVQTIPVVTRSVGVDHWVAVAKLHFDQPADTLEDERANGLERGTRRGAPQASLAASMSNVWI